MCQGCSHARPIRKADGGKKKSEWRRQHEIADRGAPLIEAGFFEVVETVKADIRKNGLKNAQSGMAWELADYGGMDVAFADVLAESGQSSAYEIAERLKITADPIFDVSAARLKKWMQANTATRAQFLSLQQRMVVNEAVNARRTYGLSLKQTSDLIVDSIGLNAPQMRALNNMRGRLANEGRSESYIQLKAQEYISKALIYRARMIAATESIDAACQGQLEFWMQAMDEDLLPKGVLKVWWTTPDDKVCPSCSKMHGQRRSLDANFSDPMGVFDGGKRPTLHPKCRCSMVLEFPK